MEDNGKKFLKIIGFSSIGCAPLLLGIFVVFIAVFFVLGLFEGGSGGTNGSLVYESECNYEETKVTVMDGDNKKVLATVSLEDYLIGVICPEIGACSGNVASMEEHYIKVKFVTARTYVLARSGYNSSDKSITIRASTRDQQWCDLEKGCVVTQTNDLIPGYSNQYFYNTYPGDYTSSEVNGTITQTYSYTENDLELLHQYYKDTYGELYLSDSYNSTITSLSSSAATEYKSSTQLYWRDQARAGKNYEEILEGTGSSGVTDSEDYVGKSLYKLGSYCRSTRGSGTLTTLGNDYAVDVSSATEVTSPITSLLSSSDISDINSYIESNVKKVDSGGEKVAAAAISLIYGLYQKGYYLPYWYGGGHALGIANGLDTQFGKSGIDQSWAAYNSGKGRTTYSYDCSGFVSWAIKNGCKSDFISTTSSGFISLPNAKTTNFDSVQPGDVFANSGHVILVIKKNEDGSVLAAESTSGYIRPHGGIQFHVYKSISGYTIVNLQDYYAKSCNI